MRFAGSGVGDVAVVACSGELLRDEMDAISLSLVAEILNRAVHSVLNLGEPAGYVVRIAGGTPFGLTRPESRDNAS